MTLNNDQHDKVMLVQVKNDFCRLSGPSIITFWEAASKAFSEIWHWFIFIYSSGGN